MIKTTNIRIFQNGSLLGGILSFKVGNSPDSFVVAHIKRVANSSNLIVKECYIVKLIQTVFIEEVPMLDIHLAEIIESSIKD